MHNQFKTQKFKHLMLAMGPRDLNSAPYSPVHCSSHSMTSFQSSELTELPVVENSQLFAQRAHCARYAPIGHVGLCHRLDVVGQQHLATGNTAQGFRSGVCCHLTTAHKNQEAEDRLWIGPWLLWGSCSLMVRGALDKPGDPRGHNFPLVSKLHSKSAKRVRAASNDGC